MLLPAPWELANTISAFAVIFAGLLTLAFCALMGRQPMRWVVAYALVFLTGLPTVWYHGFGEEFIPRVADIGSNLVLAWWLQVAALWDDSPGSPLNGPRVRWSWAIVSGVVNAAGIAWIFLAGQSSARWIFNFGEFGGFSVGETLLITDSLLATGLLYAKHAHIPARARPLLYLQTAIFLVGAVLASASNSEVQFRILAFHALWHTVAAFGFLTLWAFNHRRFVG